MITGLPRCGGMGTVWPALQLGTRRDVALKLLGGGQLTDEGRSRFRREVELTARLVHPNIARVYDAGLHQGIYYYAMELVEGVHLDEYVRTRRLGTRQVLELLLKVCRGVAHAHVRAVVHCDLKPSNILVGADGEPHVLDFGLAQLAAPDGGQVLGDGGTPAYMSPEQGAGEPIDLRSDVYSIGVMLYRVLLGRPPHRLDGATATADTRRGPDPDATTPDPWSVVPPRRIDRKFDPELEALLLRALARDPEHRYASAGELALDLERYLHGEPIAALPQKTTYLLRKRLWKHKGKVAATVTVAVILTVLAGASYVRIADEARRTQAVNELLQSALLMIDPKNAAGRDRAEAIAAAIDHVMHERFADRPHAQADIRHAVGKVLLSVGQFSAAEAQLARVLDLRARTLGERDERTLSAREDLADACRENGKPEQALRHCQEIVDACAADPAKHARALVRARTVLCRALIDLGRASEAEGVLRHAWESARRRFGDDDPDTLSACATLALTLRERKRDGDLAAAEKLARDTLARRTRVLGPTHPDRLQSQHDLASILSLVGNLDAAVDLYQEAIDGLTRLSDSPFDPKRPEAVSHPDLLIWKSDLAATLRDRGNFDAAAEIYEEVVARHLALNGPRHPYHVIFRSNLALFRAARGQWADAEQHYVAAAVARTQVAGEGDLLALRLWDAVAWAQSAQGKWEKSVNNYKRTHEVRQRTLPVGHPDLAASERNLAAAEHHRAETATTRPSPPQADAIER